jgi:hypothetical protein
MIAGRVSKHLLEKRSHGLDDLGVEWCRAIVIEIDGFSHDATRARAVNPCSLVPELVFSRSVRRASERGSFSVVTGSSVRV